jgi:hypothetical protein
MNHAKTFPTRESAERSKRFLAGGCEPRFHEPCDGFHLELTAARELPKRKAPRDTGPDRATRALVLARDGYACVSCGVSVIGSQYSLQHRVARGVGGGNEASNLIVLCGSATSPGCHLEAEKRTSDSHQRGYWLRSTEDPRLHGVMYREADGSGVTRWLEDDGGVLDEPPAGAEAVA